MINKPYGCSRIPVIMTIPAISQASLRYNNYLLQRAYVVTHLDGTNLVSYCLLAAYADARANG